MIPNICLLDHLQGHKGVYTFPRHAAITSRSFISRGDTSSGGSRQRGLCGPEFQQVFERTALLRSWQQKKAAGPGGREGGAKLSFGMVWRIEEKLTSILLSSNMRNLFYYKFVRVSYMFFLLH